MRGHVGQAVPPASGGWCGAGASGERGCHDGCDSIRERNFSPSLAFYRKRQTVEVGRLDSGAAIKPDGEHGPSPRAPYSGYNLIEVDSNPKIAFRLRELATG